MSIHVYLTKSCSLLRVGKIALLTYVIPYGRPINQAVETLTLTT